MNLMHQGYQLKSSVDFALEKVKSVLATGVSLDRRTKEGKDYHAALLIYECFWHPALDRGPFREIFHGIEVYDEPIKP